MWKPRAAVARLYRASPSVQDAVLAAALALPDLFLFSDFVLPGTDPARSLATVAFAFPGYAALAWRRRAPSLVFAVVWAHALGGGLLTRAGLFDYSPTLALLAALYGVAAYRRGRTAGLAMAAVALPVALAVDAALADVPAGEHTTALLGLACFYALLNLEVWGMGRWVKLGRETAARDRRDLERARETVLLERARTARELHDIVANAVTVMVLQAGGSRRLVRSAPDRVENALTHIEDIGKTAVAELRHMLLVLRATDQRLAVGPSFGLADLDPLLNGVRRAGLPARLEVAGTPVKLEQGVDLTAYRLVQEALTNAVKHAGPGAGTTVRLVWGEPEQVRIEITDDGRGTPAADRSALSTGQGLLGLRERVAVCGGSLSAGPTADGGFRVAAVLPLVRPDAMSLTGEDPTP